MGALASAKDVGFLKEGTPVFQNLLCLAKTRSAIRSSTELFCETWFLLSFRETLSKTARRLVSCAEDACQALRCEGCRQLAIRS